MLVAIPHIIKFNLMFQLKLILYLEDKLLCGLCTDHDFRLNIDGMIYILTIDFNPARRDRVLYQYKTHRGMHAGDHYLERTSD